MKILPGQIRQLTVERFAEKLGLAEEQEIFTDSASRINPLSTEIEMLRMDQMQLRRERDAAISRAEKAEKALQVRIDDAQAFLAVEPGDEKARDLVYEWAMTDTRGTTPFRELQHSVVEQLVRRVAKALRESEPAELSLFKKQRDELSALVRKTEQISARRRRKANQFLRKLRAARLMLGRRAK